MTVERRYFRTSELRATTDASTNKSMLEGYAVKWYKLSKPIPFKSGKATFREMFLPNSFNESLEENTQYFCIGHNHNKTYGDTREGTLQLNSDALGLRFKLDVTDENRALYEAVRGGNLREMSVAFVAQNDEFLKRSDENIRLVKKARLIEISAVEKGAHNDTYLNIAMSADRKRLLLKTMTI